jgi:hypothetical protein
MNVVTRVCTSVLMVEAVLFTIAYRQPSRAALLSKFQCIINRENSTTPKTSDAIGKRTRAVSTKTFPRRLLARFLVMTMDVSSSGALITFRSGKSGAL